MPLIKLPDWLVNLRTACGNCCRRCRAVVLKSSPPVVEGRLREYLDELAVTPAHMLRMYLTFHRVRQSEEEEIVRVAHEIDGESLLQLVRVRRKWCASLLRNILMLGGCRGYISWDKFLWIILRFCSLTSVELAQTLFLVIGLELTTDTPHYLTIEQLKRFYAPYAKQTCPDSFSTKYIDFERLPHSRYYISDFTELVQRFGQLINPMRHLQRSLQEYFPSHEFWDTFESSLATCRKISEDFFRMESTRVFLRGEPPFRETCDMLVPDALGAEALNQDQWVLRARGLRQLSVWGEQLPPDIAAVYSPDAIQHVAPSKIGVAPTLPPPGHTFEEKPQSATKRTARGTKAPAPKNKKVHDPAQLSLLAATLDETGAPPTEIPAPAWMRGRAVDPAPVQRGPDPPLPNARLLRGSPGPRPLAASRK